MSSASKKAKIIFRVLFALVSLLVLSMFTVLIMFYNDGQGGNLLGYSVIYTEEPQFEKIQEKSAVFVKQMDADEIPLGYIVVYRSDNQYFFAKITGGEAVDAVYRIEAVNKNMDTLVIPSKDVVGFADFTSTILGRFIAFSKTKEGLLIINLCPFLLFILWELVKVIRKHKKEPVFVPIKKQEETPDFLDEAFITPPKSPSEEKVQEVLFEHPKPQKDSDSVPKSNPKLNQPFQMDAPPVFVARPKAQEIYPKQDTTQELPQTVKAYSAKQRDNKIIEDDVARRLDRLLAEEDDDADSYNIDDILSEFHKR
jgi:MFS superfamily sulfate permease-like transporter